MTNITRLTSAANPRIKAIRALHKLGFRSERILVEGNKLIGEALRSGLRPESAWTHGPVDLDLDCPWFEVPAQLYASLSPTRANQGPLVVFEAPLIQQFDVRTREGAFLLLDRIQDPGNAGSLVRAAAAFGLTAVLWAKPCVYPYHHACIRASAGSIFQLPVYTVDTRLLADTSLPMIGADGHSPTAVQGFLWPNHFILAMGHEGGGLQESLRRQLNQYIKIPTTDRVESLNVASAAHILLFQWFQNNGG